MCVDVEAEGYVRLKTNFNNIWPKKALTSLQSNKYRVHIQPINTILYEHTHTQPQKKH